MEWVVMTKKYVVVKHVNFFFTYRPSLHENSFFQNFCNQVTDIIKQISNLVNKILILHSMIALRGKNL